MSADSAASSASPWSPDRAAIAEALPLFVPAIPFGFVVGLAITESEMPAWVGWSTSLVIFAGASQLAVVTLAGVASMWAVILAGLVINSRHVMYAAALAPVFRDQPRWFRWLGPFVLIDQVFALVTLHTDRSPSAFRRYYATIGVFFYLGWTLVVSLGMVVGPVVPEAWRLDAAPAIMFTGLVVFAVTTRPAAVAAIVGAVVGLLAIGLRDRLGVIVGALAGVVAGTIAETRAEARRAAVVEDDMAHEDGTP